MSQIKPNVDGVYAGFAGINGARFLKQYAEYGLKNPVLGNPTCVDEGILRNMGDEALDVYSGSWYAATLDTPDNVRFVKAVQDEAKVTPGFYTAGTYTAALFLEAAQPDRAGAHRCVRKAGSQRLCAQSRAQRRPAREQHRGDLPQREPVLDLRS